MVHKRWLFRKTGRHVRLGITILMVLLLFSASFPFSGALAARKIQVDYPNYEWAEPGIDELLKRTAEIVEKENPDIQIVATAVPDGEFNDKMFMRMVAGNPPDILYAETPQILQYIEMGLLEPFDKWLDEAKIDRSSFVSSWNSLRKNDKTYGVVQTMNPRALIYNAEMYKRAGVDVPRTPWDFVDAIAKLSHPEKRIYGFGIVLSAGSLRETHQTILPIIRGLGGWTATAEGVITIDEPPVFLALQMLKFFSDREYVPRGVSGSTLRKMFWEGRIASLISGGWFFGFTQEKGYSELYENMNAVAPPFPYPTITVNDYHAIPKEAKHKEAAAKYLLTMLRPEIQKMFVEVCNQIPAMKLNRNAPYMKDFMAAQPWFESFLSLAETAKSRLPRGFEAKAAEAQKIIAGHFLNAVFGSASIKSELEKARNELERLQKEM